MNTANLKLDIINKITNLKETHVIDEINRMLDFEAEQGIFKITSKQKERILEGREEYKSGKILSEKEANKQIQQEIKEI